MHKVTFFPVGNQFGNADTCLIDLKGGHKILFDFNDRRDATDPKEKRIDLVKALKGNLAAAKRNNFDVVAFTHLDDDHIHDSTEFFFLRHSLKYQSSDRVRIDTMWVPAAVIVEDRCGGEAEIIQKEARYRLKQGKGIRVFSRPTMLKRWLEREKLTFNDISDCVTDAGRPIPGWTLKEQGIEFFVHSPFAARMNEGVSVDRNDDALFVQATFLSGARKTRLILSADVNSDVIEDIVRTTKRKGNQARLEWDINNVPHHSSYKSLDKDQKGTGETVPVPEVDWLYSQGSRGGFLVSTSQSPRSKPSEEQPPHEEAIAYYKRKARQIGGQYLITMEYPSFAQPAPMVFEISDSPIKLSESTTNLVKAASTPAVFTGSSYDDSHAEDYTRRWPNVNLVIKPVITCSVHDRKHGSSLGTYGSNGVNVTAGHWFQFNTAIAKNVLRSLGHGDATGKNSVEIYWQVTNTGAHARAVDALRGEISESEIGLMRRWENTLYTGRHWVRCFAVLRGKNLLIGMSDKFYVNIQNPDYN